MITKKPTPPKPKHGGTRKNVGRPPLGKLKKKHLPWFVAPHLVDAVHARAAITCETGSECLERLLTYAIKMS